MVNASKRAVILLKHFISFLEIYGQENYGESAEVDWIAVNSFCHSYGLLDFNEQLSEIIYTQDDEEFRDRCFSYIEDKILSGYPVWRLFTMSQWLHDKLEMEHSDGILQEKRRYFHATRCYRCRHIVQRISFIHPETKYPTSYDRCDQYHVTLLTEGYVTPLFQYGCRKRNSIMDDECKGHPRRMRAMRFQYKKFNCDNFSRNWMMDTWKLRDCPYFDEAEGVTFESFMKDNIDITMHK